MAIAVIKLYHPMVNQKKVYGVFTVKKKRIFVVQSTTTYDFIFELLMFLMRSIKSFHRLYS